MYTYFVMLVIIAVCILLNVIVAFFVESKFHGDDVDSQDDTVQ